ncbi:phage antirepressor KilAC domain-containing protein [Aggregatibacter actinomycetemcomitans]|uniref:phage antirepressor KilAC domain-containing protein n=1 Tax=Aggregatibacter actinomycetemcomitans TaxID=714 RepID=UPI002151B8AB|nr:phage antirepressor KilAC domain-containing protein [Aggregatibacter actinomycetemcomitans]
MKIQKFFYKNIDVSFDERNFLDATSIAKHFDKFVKDYLKTAQTQDYINALAQNLSVGNIILTDNDLVIVRQGGAIQGTWLHPKLAVNFARWLSADFAVWCDLKIDELIKNQQKPTALLPDFTNPAESARAWAEQYEKRELAEQKLIAAQPKVAFVDHYVDVGTSKSLREVAKILKMPERAMIARLIEDKLLYRQSNNLLPHQSAHTRDLFTVKTGTAEHGHNFTQTRVTSKCIEFIASRYASELMQ